MTTKIAVPTRDGRIDDHFGHCDHYTIYTVEEKKVIATEILPSPQGCGCKSNIANELQEMGVTVMLAGNMGDGAKNKLEGCGIKVIRGCNGATDSVVKGYLAGFVLDFGQSCNHHDCPSGHEH